MVQSIWVGEWIDVSCTAHRCDRRFFEESSCEEVHEGLGGNLGVGMVVLARCYKEDEEVC